MNAGPAPERILSVSQITRLIKSTLADAFPAVWVKGEMSGVKLHTSGHLYFTLKEGNQAVLDGVMWKTSAQRLAFEPKDGLEVEVFGGISVYEPRGRYQIYAQEMRPAGIGALLQQLEELKRRLLAEGLFDAERKRPLPPFPAAVGLVTSPTGAAVRDMVKVLRARWPSIRIVLAPVRVQGEGAAAEIAAAVERFNRHGAVDVLLVGRGGGSLEDLWAFNEEAVVRAVAASDIPVIAGVGHEVDQTLVELAADVRAATPSNAAELAVPDRRTIEQRVKALDARATRALRGAVEERRRHLRALLAKHGFRRQRDVLDTFRQRADQALERIAVAVRTRLRRSRERLASAARSYGLRLWPSRLGDLRRAVADARRQLTTAAVQGVETRRVRYGALAGRLRSLSPQSVLERGFCIARGPDGTLLRTSQGLATGDLLTLEFARGAADARVETVRHGGSHAAEEEDV